MLDMTTFAQSRSPFGRLEAGSVRAPKKYDIRVVDQFYVYCQAVSRIEDHRETLIRSWTAAKRVVWIALLAGSLLFYYLMERAAHAASLL